MDARSYLKGQGWRGEGHSLDTTNRGLSRPLLVTHKGDLTGLGTKKNDFSDQWWMTSFDKNLKGLGQTPPDTPREDLPQLPGFKHKNLYSNFVKAETLESTFKNDAQLAKLAFPDNKPMQQNPETLARRPSMSSTVGGFVLGLAKEDMDGPNGQASSNKSTGGDKKRKREDDQEEKPSKKKSKKEKKAKKDSKKKQEQDQSNMQTKETKAKKEPKKKQGQNEDPPIVLIDEKKREKYTRGRAKRAAKREAKLDANAPSQNGVDAGPPNASMDTEDKKKKKKRKSQSEDAADSEEIPPKMYGKYTEAEQKALRDRLKIGRRERSKAARKERKKSTGQAKCKGRKQKAVEKAERKAAKTSAEGSGA